MDPGSEALWTERMLANAGWVRALARRLVGDSWVADDVVQQTWLAALTHPPSAESSPRPWLARVLRAQIALYRRGRMHRRDREADAAAPEPLPSAEELLIRTEAQERLVRAVVALREPYRSTIVLHYYEGLSSAEIARRRAVPDATVRSQIHRGIEILRMHLDDDFGDRRSWCMALAPLDASSLRPLAPVAPRLMLATKLALAGLLVGGLGWLAIRSGSEREVLGAGASPVQAKESVRAPSTAQPEDSSGLLRVPVLAQRESAGCEVRVVDRETGEGLPDFEVAIRRPDGERLLARTGSTGAFRLDPPGTAGTFLFELIDDARLRQREAWVHDAPLVSKVPSESRELAADARELLVQAPSGPTYSLELDLPPGLSLGQLRAHLHDSGAPAFDTRKWSMHLAPVRAPGALGGPWVRFAKLDAAFLGAGPPWTLELSSADGLWSGSCEVSSIVGRHDGKLLLALEPRARLRGRVLDAAGAVTEDVLLKLFHADGRPTYRRMDTDGEGSFEVAALVPGPYRMTAESPRHGSAEIRFLLEAGLEAVHDIEMVRAPPGGSVSGRLASRTGQYKGPVVVVLASTEIERRRFYSSAAWQLEGEELVSSFTFDQVPRGRYRLHAFAIDDQLPWQPRGLELDAPAAGAHLECQDDVPTTSMLVQAVDAQSGEALASFALVTSIDGGPEVIFDQVRPVPAAAAADESRFEWRVRFAGVTWALRSGAAQLPLLPRGAALRWAVYADGHAPAFGDQTAFVDREGRLSAIVELERGWGCRLRIVSDSSEGQPLAGVELWADGRLAAVSRPDGLLDCRLKAAPLELELRRSDGTTRNIEPPSGERSLFTEVRIPR